MPGAHGRMDWANVLDFNAALVTLHYELQGDWYRDPWGWPELDWLVAHGTDALVARLNGTGVKAVARIDVPKENFGTRPAIVMDPVDRLAYQALVDVVGVSLVGDLKPWVYGWRLQTPPERGKWSPNKVQHSAFLEGISLSATFHTAALKTDIVSCFASIDIDRLSEMIESRCGNGRVPERIVDLVGGWSRVVGRSGLAQRSVASAALANMFLSPVDEVLHEFNWRGRRRVRRRPGGLVTVAQVPRVARWMDDIWAFGHDAGDLRKLQLDIQNALRATGLEMNHSKTALLEGEAVAFEVKQVQHSAVDEALLGDEPDEQPLLELIEILLQAPSTASRTSLKFATRRMREHEVYDPVEQFAEHAREMPHAADALARLFRDSDYWRELPSWFVEYSSSPWGSIEWSVAQFGTAFPSKLPLSSDKRRLRPVVERLGKMLETEPPLPLLALGASRLAAWDPDEARPLLRGLAVSSSSPQVRRVLALALSNANEERAMLRRILGEFEENQVTAETLKTRNYRVKTKADFDG